MNKFYRGNVFRGAVFAAIIILLCTAAYFNETAKVQNIGYNEFLQFVQNGEVEHVTLSDSEKISFKLKSSKTPYKTDNPRKTDFKETLLAEGISVSEGSAAYNAGQFGLSILLFGGAFFAANKLMGRSNPKGAMALNASDASVKDTGYNFSLVAGNEEAKDSVTDIVSFIKNPEKYSKLGARMPRGIIFYGPPGTGKTLLAKAISGEAGVPFYAVSGSDFVQMYVGVGAGRIRELFNKAREAKKAVIFIDEIDALGKKRTGAPAGGNDEREQTLNALLTEMSGFSSTDGIVVIAATNRLDTLDEALLRPGRFDRQVEIALPDMKAREQIIRHHAANKPIDASVDLVKLSKSTVYFSGAMLENLLNEAAIFAANRESNEILQDDIDKAYYTVIAGSEKKDRSNLREKDRMITAFHESGHALVAKLVSPESTVSKITIIPSTKGAGGFCVNIPQDKMYYTKRELKSQIMISYAGRAAEEIIFGEDEVTTGASNDIEKAARIVKDIVTKYGMGDKTGLINTKILGGKVLALKECCSLTEELYSQTRQMISENIDILNRIANALLEKETLHEDEIDMMFSKSA
ncbi:metalloprotease m41 ftsh [Holotrichia oblita]|nr:metalloprotease m41 ftsh [Holotrichia oblita]